MSTPWTHGNGRFGGTIGRYHFESTPWWPEAQRAAAGRAERADRGARRRGLRAARVLRLRHRHARRSTGWRPRGLQLHQLPHHGAVLADPRLPADRAQPPRGRHGPDRSSWRPASPATTAASPARPASSPRCLPRAGWAAWAVGKWHLTPEEECHAAATARALAARPRASSASTASSAARPTSSRPTLVRDNHQIEPPRRSAGRLPPDRGPDRPRHRAGVGPARRRRGQAVLPVPRVRRPATRRTRRRPIGRALPRPVRRRDGTGGARSASRASSPPGCCPRTARAVAAAGLGAGVGRPVGRRAAACYARYMEAFAGFLTHTDHQLGRLLDFLADTGDLDNTLVMLLSDNGASSEGGPVGSLNDGRVWNFLPRTVDEALARIDEIGGPRCHNNYPWGWTVAGNTPFRRWKREVHEGGVCDPLIVHWPRRHRRRGRAAPPVRARDRHPADRPRRAAASPPPPRSTASTQRRDRGRQLRRDLRRRPRAGAPRRRSTSRCSAAGRCTSDGLEGGDCGTRSSSTIPASTRRRGSSTTSRSTRPSATTSRPRSPSGWRR